MLICHSKYSELTWGPELEKALTLTFSQAIQ